MSKNDVDHIKSFFDVLAEDARVYACWGASSFGKGQHRQECSNRWLKCAEPRAMDLGEVVSHSVFMELLSPNFPKDVDPDDLVAVVKRCNVIVLGENACYVRPDGEKHVDVPVVRYVQGVKMIKTESEELLAKHWDGEPVDQVRLEKGLE
eukprot:1448164-Amphidinium_carterae.1